MFERPKARIGWRGRLLGVVGMLQVAIVSHAISSWWAVLVLDGLLVLAMQFALNGAYFRGQAAVHEERLAELLDAEVTKFLETLDDD